MERGAFFARSFAVIRLDMVGAEAEEVGSKEYVGGFLEESEGYWRNIGTEECRVGGASLLTLFT